LLLYADSPSEFREEIAPAIQREAVEKRALGELRRPPRSVMARQLREWRLYWVKQFVLRTHCPEESAHLLIDRLFVVRYLLAHKIFRRTRGHFQQRFSELTRACWSGRAERCGEQL